MVAYSLHILAVYPGLPVKSIKELVDLAKAKPGKLNYAASSSVGSAPHLAGVDFATRTGIAPMTEERQITANLAASGAA